MGNWKNLKLQHSEGQVFLRNVFFLPGKHLLPLHLHLPCHSCCWSICQCQSPSFPEAWNFRCFPSGLTAALPLLGASPELSGLYQLIRSQTADPTGRRMTLPCLCPLTSQKWFQSSEACFWKQDPRGSTILQGRRKRYLWLSSPNLGQGQCRHLSTCR